MKVERKNFEEIQTKHEPDAAPHNKLRVSITELLTGLHMYCRYTWVRGKPMDSGCFGFPVSRFGIVSRSVGVFCALLTEGSEPWDKDHVAIARSELHLTPRARLV